MAKLEKTADGARLRDFRVLFQQQPSLRSRHHYGSRIVFADDGTMFITLASGAMRAMRKIYPPISAR